MANPEHVRLLQDGVGAWNDWRGDNGDVHIDLSGHDFSGKDFSGIDLGPTLIDQHDIYKMSRKGADLSHADFRGCNLSGANLHVANMRQSNLREAKLSSANLSHANLALAVIEEADCRGADFLRADLFYAWARNTDFQKASFWEAALMGVVAEGANFAGCQFHDVMLNHAKCNKADFRHASLTKAHFRQVSAQETNFTSANLAGASARGSDFEGATFHKATLSNGHFNDCRLRRANLVKANLVRTILEGSDLSGADLTGATTEARMRLKSANLSNANLSDLDIRQADLRYATLVQAKLRGTLLTGCRIYGASAWDIRGEPGDQTELVVSEFRQKLTVDDVEMAQFLNLMVNNKKIRNVLNTITSKSVLILGRFTPERKAILDALRNELRKHGFVPILFDFDKPESKDFTETVMTLAGLVRFIVADITNPSSSPLELAYVVPNYMTPLIPILQEDEEPFSMFSDLHRKYGDWVFKPMKYRDEANLIGSLKKGIIARALEKHEEIVRKKQDAQMSEHADDFQE